MSSNKKRRELNRAIEEHDRVKLSAQFAVGNHSMLNIAESILAKENAALKAKAADLQEQVDLQIPKMAFATLQSKSAALVDALTDAANQFRTEGMMRECNSAGAALAAFKGVHEMTTPTREQVVQWADKASSNPMEYHIAFATLARADLEATIAELQDRLDKLHAVAGTFNTRFAIDEATIAEQAKQLEEMAEAIRVKDALLSEIAKQTPEKPDYWSSCSQCEHNSAEAEDALSIQPSPEILAARDQRVAEACAELCDKFIEDETPELIRAGRWKEYL